MKLKIPIYHQSFKLNTRNFTIKCQIYFAHLFVYFSDFPSGIIFSFLEVYLKHFYLGSINRRISLFSFNNSLILLSFSNDNLVGCTIFGWLLDIYFFNNIFSAFPSFHCNCWFVFSLNCHTLKVLFHLWMLLSVLFYFYENSAFVFFVYSYLQNPRRCLIVVAQ